MYDMAKTLTVRLDTALERRIAKLAKTTGQTESALVRQLLTTALLKEEFRALRAATVPRATAAGYLTDEDVFRDVS